MKEMFSKITKIIFSRAFYFALGLFFFVAFLTVQAAWNSTVGSGQPLTATLWNDVVAKLGSMDGQITNINAGNINYQHRNCEKIDYVAADWVMCPAGKYVAGVQDAPGGLAGMNGVVCCN